MSILCLIGVLSIFVVTFTSPINKNKHLFIPSNTKTISLLDSLQNTSVFDKTMIKIVDPIIELLLRRKPYSQEISLIKGTNFISFCVQLRTKQPINTVSISIPEGLNIMEIASIFRHKMKIDSVAFLSLCTNQQFIDSLNINANSLEGYLYPNTYEFYQNSTPQVVLKRLTKEFNKMWTKYCSSVEVKDQRSILTLASIVEAETPIISERRTVAGVYQNRINKGMKLEADPTVQYALKSKKRLYYKDLEIDNPYNTYRYKGLPPGPINSPSISSILAAISPENHSYLFFVARGDNSNLHYFSTTYSQHLESVALYRARNK
ncbi:MAG: endolytic transglycosylase MltG [Candidatus Kapabacteria bacterium]|nr:endolytic transglycosylase MltG [Candidatus Kapabacteria bacterium]